MQEQRLDVCFNTGFVKVKVVNRYKVIQSTLVIANFKGLSEILRDICTSTYQVCRIKEK